MRLYVFKIKSYDDYSDGHNSVLISVCCPLESLYDSVKATVQLKDFKGFITQTDYIDEFTQQYVSDDVYVGDVEALFKSKSLKEFLVKCHSSDYENITEEVVDEISQDC